MEYLIKIIAKYLQGLRKPKESEDKETSSIMIQIVLLGVFPILYSLTLLPPGVSVNQIIFAGVVFIIIVIFSFRILKYFKLM